MSKKVLYRWIAALLTLGLLASACGGRDDESDAGDTTTTSADPGTTDPGTSAPDTTDPAADPCEGAELEATEIGVTADTIKVIVMADSDNALAPGLFEGAREGAFKWAEDVNSRGGLACRNVEIEFHDSKLNPTETTNGFLKACTDALALVGTTVLFGTDTADLEGCADGAGNPTGVPDLAYITTEVPHQCSSVSFHLSRPGAECPYSSGERGYVASTGIAQWVLDQNDGALNGVFIVPGDLPSTTASAVPQITAHEQLGIVYDKVYSVSGSAPQSAFTPYVQALRENASNFVYNGSNDAAIAKFINEATAQGFDTSSVNWVCSLSCYTPAFLENGAAIDGTYVWLPFVPFEEADANEELASFMDAIGTDFPPAWAAGAWGDGILLEQAINGIVAADGPNAITRQRLLDELRTIDSFDVNGWWGTVDLTTTETISDCFMVMQVQAGEFVRVHPEERGTLDCGPENVTAVTANPDTFTPDS